MSTDSVLMAFDDILAERQAQDRPKTGQDSLETGARQAKMCPRQAPDRLQVAELMAEGEQLIKMSRLPRLVVSLNNKNTFYFSTKRRVAGVADSSDLRFLIEKHTCFFIFPLQ